MKLVAKAYFMSISLSVPTRKSLHNSLCGWYNRNSIKYFWDSVEDVLYIDHHICVVRFSLLFFLISLHLSFGSQTQPQFFFFFCEVPLLSRALFRHEKPRKFLSNSESYFASFQTQSLSAVFAQLLDVIWPYILRVFLQKAFPSPHFRHQSPQSIDVALEFFFFSTN